MQRSLPLVLGLLALSSMLRANTFTLGSNPNQVFDSENVGPYPGTLTGSTATSFFCLDDTFEQPDAHASRRRAPGPRRAREKASRSRDRTDAANHKFANGLQPR